MKIRVTKSAAPSTLKKPSIVDRLNSPIVRTCVLNLIAQIALGTPMAAQAQRNSQLTRLNPYGTIALPSYSGSVASTHVAWDHAAVKEHKN